MELLHLLAMLPGGILAKDLDTLWKSFKCFKGDENRTQNDIG
jgi:hypothetical protein